MKLNKVWVVMGSVPYEFDRVVAVFSTEQAANQKRDKMLLEDRNTREYEFITVKEWEVKD